MTTTIIGLLLLLAGLIGACGYSLYTICKTVEEKHKINDKYIKARKAIENQAIEVNKLHTEAEKLEEWNRILNDENERLKDVAGDPYRQGRADLWKEIQDTFGDVLDDQMQK